MEIECVSAVSKVVVHARGALVTREVALPADLPAGVIDLALPGITVAAQPGSARAALEGSERLVAAVQSSIVIPSSATKPGPSVTKVRDLTARRARLDDEHGILSARRNQLAATMLSPSLRMHDGTKRERHAIDARFADTIVMATLLAKKTAEVDERIFAIEREQREVARAIEAARLEDAQTSSKARMGDEHPSRRFIVRVTGSGTAGRLLLTYAVAAARWWPTYTLRIEDAGARATWAFEALVAQRTGEDWNAALLALSSADLVFDARLPELASLRFGRAQPSLRRPIRPAPAGVDDMFVAYMAFRPGSAPSVAGYGQVTAAPPPLPSFAAPHDADEDRTPTKGYSKMLESEARAPHLPAPRPAPGGAPPPPMQAAMPMSMSAPMMPQMMPARMMRARGGMPMAAFEADEQGAIGEPEPEPELVAGAQWSDLDSLVLASADRPKRGRLVPQPVSFQTSGAIDRDLAVVDSVAKERWIDPFESRGMFDHRYEATGRADVPSDGRVHRVGVGAAPCHVLISWRTVPSESTEVYREANVINPFEQALLGGPVDVYLDGSLLAETTSSRIDRGGTLWCGMGVDDRVKVARNVRADEESAGLLGGSLAVTHAVGIELTSTIKDPIKVVVLERVPVTDDKAVEIKIVKATPVPAAYDQADRGSPVRGGCRFEVAVTAGKPTAVEIVYRLVFASKLDIVGGSRRG